MGVKHAAADKLVLAETLRQPKAFFTFQPGTTHVRSGLPSIKKLIARSDLFILNKDEAHHILSDGERPIMNLLESFRHLGAKTVIITDGPNGADAFDGTNHWHIAIFPGEAKERTGAGDSFATAVTSALLKGEDLPTAMRWGAANSWSVVREIGPQKGLLSTTNMNRILKKFSSIKPKLIKH
jgi:sugar/nucleoside kinase (ribokinase family)